MGVLEQQRDNYIQPPSNTGIGIAGAVVGVIVVAFSLAIVWTLLSGLIGLIWLGIKIATVLGIIVVGLVLVGMFRTHVLKR